MSRRQEGVDEARVNVSVEGGNATRVPLADLTNREERLGIHGIEGKMKPAITIATDFSEVSEPVEDKQVSLQTPTKTCGDVVNDCGDVEVALVQTPVLPIQASHHNGGDEIERSCCGVKSVLRKVSTNFTERSNQRSASCPPLGVRRDASRIKFADQLQEACSPPKWYLDWLESEATASASGRGDVRIQPLKSREISPRRKRDARDATAQSRDSEPPRWR